MRRLAAFPILSLLLLTAGQAQTEEQTDPESGKFGHSFLNKLADTPLPFTGDDSDLSIDIRPKLGDIIHEPYIRLPIELTYSFTNKREGSFGIIPFFKNPMDSEPLSSNGYVTFGVKQRLDNFIDNRLSLAFGADVRIPLEEIPNALPRYSYDSYMPYLTAAYELDKKQKWLAFATIQHQIVGEDRRDRLITEPDPLSLAVIRPGLIYQPGGEYRYSLQVEYKTDRVDGGSDEGIKVIPGVTWFPPPDTPFFRSIAGHFELTLDVEFALAEIEEEEIGGDIGVNLGVRWRLYPKKPVPGESVF